MFHKVKIASKLYLLMEAQGQYHDYIPFLVPKICLHLLAPKILSSSLKIKHRWAEFSVPFLSSSSTCKEITKYSGSLA